MPFNIRKYSQKTHKEHVENAISTSVSYIPAGSRRFRVSSFITLNDFSFSNGLTFNSSNPIYDDAFFTLHMIRKEIDESISVISIEDGAVPILRVNIAGNENGSRGIIVDMSGIMHELKNSSDLHFRRQLYNASFLFFVLGFTLFAVSFPECRTFFYEYYLLFMTYISSFIKPPQIKPEITFKLF